MLCRFVSIIILSINQRWFEGGGHRPTSVEMSETTLLLFNRFNNRIILIEYQLPR